jgi:hypothetical protein
MTKTNIYSAIFHKIDFGVYQRFNLILIAIKR